MMRWVSWPEHRVCFRWTDDNSMEDRVAQLEIFRFQVERNVGYFFFTLNVCDF